MQAHAQGLSIPELTSFKPGAPLTHPCQPPSPGWLLQVLGPCHISRPPAGPRPGPRLLEGNCPTLPGADSATFHTQLWSQASEACWSLLGAAARGRQEGAKIL